MANILIVEDNPDVNLLYQRLFFRQEIDCALNGMEAIESLDKKQYDLVLLDLHLPKVSGVEVLEFLRGQDKHREVVVIIVSSDDTLKHRCQDIGINHWLTKPIEIEDLLTTVQKYLANGKSAHTT
jgi:two-component system chemotaxis response regulator CheY